MFLQIALISAQLWLGEITRQRPKRTSFDEFIKNNEPSEVRPIVYAGGTIELTPTRAWYGDYKQRAVERDSHWSDYLWAGGLAFLLDTITVAYRSYAGEMFPLCYGPDAHVERITINDRLVFQATQGTDNAGGGFLIDDPQAWGGDQPPGEGGEYAFCQVTRGNYTEPSNAYLESQLATAPNKVPALHGVSTLVKLGPSGETESGYFHAGGVGVAPRFKLWKVTVRRQPDNLATGFHKIGRHMNPIEVIYEWSTSLDCGAKIPLEHLNLNNWRSIAQDLHTEGNGWSGRIENATSPQAVVKDILAQIDAVDDISPSLGLTIRLIRRTYSFGSLRVLNRDNITRVERFTPGTREDTKNKVEVEFPDQDNNFKERKALYIDSANQLMQDGRTVPETKTFLGVADFDQANVLATRDGRAISLPRAPLDCFVFASWGRLSYRGEVVLFQWESPSFSIVMRVQEITPNGPDEKDYHIVMIEDQFSTGLKTFGNPGVSQHVDPGAGLDVAPPSASWNDVEVPPDGLRLDLLLTNTNQFQATIAGAIAFGAYAPGGQYARIWITEPGGVQTLSPMHLVPDENDEARFQWPAQAVGEYEFCVQTYSTRGVTNGVKICATIDIAAIGSPSVSPSASVSPSISPSLSPSASESPSPSASISPSSSISPSVSPSTSASQSPSSSISPSVPAFSPLDVTGLDWWLSGDDATINGVPQFDWPDSSPANLPYGQNTAINEPTLVSGPNSHQLVEFGSNKWLVPDPSSRTLAVANTLIVICTKSTAQDYIISGTEAGIHGSPAFISGFNNGGVQDFEYYNDFGSGNVERASFATSTDTNLHILILTRTDDTSNAVGYFDGGSPAFSVAVNNNCDWNGLGFTRIGSQHTAVSSNYTGKIADILHWPNIVSKADLNDLLDYFGTLYSISVTPIP